MISLKALSMNTLNFFLLTIALQMIVNNAGVLNHMNSLHSIEVGRVVSTRGCFKDKAVIFVGQIRGDTALWELANSNLARANNFDIIMDVWSSNFKEEADLRAVFQPCFYYSEKYDESFRERALKEYPDLVYNTSMDMLYLSKTHQREIYSPTRKTVDTYYRFMHAYIHAVQKYNHTVLFRTRLDMMWFDKYLVPDRIEENAVYGRYDFHAISTVKTTHTCPSTYRMEDVFLFGDRIGMVAHLRFLASATRIIDTMVSLPLFRRRPATPYPVNDTDQFFKFGNEHIQAWSLILSKVKCFEAAPAPACLARNVLPSDGSQSYRCSGRTKTAVLVRKPLKMQIAN